jgi:2-dehydropantoate 2-reductase
MKFAVVGVGGIGGYFGGRLAQAGRDVTFIARGSNLEALRRDGLSVTSSMGSVSLPHVQAVAADAPAGSADVVLMCVKTWQLPDAMASLPGLLSTGGCVMTLQNGVEAPGQAAAVVGQNAVLPGLARIFAHLEAPGRVRHVGGPASLTFAEWNQDPSERVAALHDALTTAGVAVVPTADIWADLWAKFLFVVPFGALGSATNAPIGVLRSRPGTRRLLEMAMGEIREVALRMGVALPSDAVEQAMAFVDQQPADGRSSLQRDLLAGRPNELEAWTGAVVRLGRTSGVPTPVNSVLYEVLAALVPPGETPDRL